LKGPAGFFDLASPADVLAKLRHDFSRVLDNPLDTYAAFDFFVTAEHLLDWVFPGAANRVERTRMRESSALLRVTSHLASGAKHFRVEASHHRSVGHERTHDGGFAAGDFDPRDFDTSSLVVGLQSEDASELGIEGALQDDPSGYGMEIRVCELAQRVLDHWESEITGSAAPAAG